MKPKRQLKTCKKNTRSEEIKNNGPNKLITHSSSRHLKMSMSRRGSSRNSRMKLRYKRSWRGQRKKLRNKMKN